jgi:hypothetical protein
MILIPTKGPEDWKHLLADPDLHWKKGYSAYALAYRWEEAEGLPSEIKEALESIPALEDVELLLAIPEYKVSLPGGGAASQNDIFCLARTRHSLVSIMIEGKVNQRIAMFIYLDTETTGNGPDDRLCQIAFKPENGQAVCELFNPGRPISIDAMAIHHITEKMVADKPPFRKAMNTTKLQEAGQRHQ